MSGKTIRQHLHVFDNALTPRVRAAAVVLGLGMLLPLPASATTYVLMDFDGDAAFPSLTYGANTLGLAAFTGSAFGLNAAGLAAVESSILTKVGADYAPYDIAFVTDTSGLGSWYTWGIDDSAYVFPNTYKTPAGTYDPIDPSVACPAANVDCYRLFGKARNTAGDVDRTGVNIYHPTYARTWAGSFALGPLSADPSSPSLLGESLEEIAQALANSAAHEISHLFGVEHPAFCGQPCFDLMWTEVESLESSRDKSFSAGDQAILLEALGAHQTNGRIPEPATLALFGAALAGLAASRRRKQN